MNEALTSFLSLPERDQQDVFEAAANRLDTLPSYVEKDLWVCVVLDALYNGLPDGHPKLLFKGGTSLSKAFGLIDRFSEDIDLVVHRDGLDFDGDRDPTIEGTISNKRRKRLFEELNTACSDYIREDLRLTLANLIDGAKEGCRVVPAEDDLEELTLLVEYPTLYASSETSYVSPRVKIEAGARSALDPNLTCTVGPFIDDELSDWPLGSGQPQGARARTHLLGEAPDPPRNILRISRRATSAIRQQPDLTPLLRRRNDHGLRCWRVRFVQSRTT